MKTITYNPETHVLVPREPSRGMIDAMPPVEEIGYWAMYEEAIAAAPQPEPVDVGSVGWKHDCAALCANDIELWIDRCPHCGKPRHNHPPAAAIIKATKPLEDSLAVVKKDRADLYMETLTLTLRDQLAKAEQRVAEACKSMCLRLVRKENEHAAGYGFGYLNYSAQDVADFIDNGEWRKHMKGD